VRSVSTLYARARAFNETNEELFFFFESGE
jgi:hypothetical protein